MLHSSRCQCIPFTAVCDVHVDCNDASDELSCDYEVQQAAELVYPAIVDYDGRGAVQKRPLARATEFPNNSSSACPTSHFLCTEADFCLPVYVRCNGVNDCPGREDEAGCDSYTCPGFYRCRGSRVCLHAKHVCDAEVQCPQHDDEQFCELTCPPECTCFGWSFVCSQPFLSQEYLELRYLDASNSRMSLRSLVKNTMLIHFSQARCDVTSLDNVTLPNLRSLDLSDNHLRAVRVSDLKGLPRLLVLFLSGNPIARLFADVESSEGSVAVLTHLDLSRVKLKTFDFTTVAAFPGLQILNLSRSGTDRLLEDRRKLVKRLRVLDVRGCPVTFFSTNVLRDQDELQTVFSENYKLCCPAVLPAGFTVSRCQAPFNEISSCDDLLRSDVYRVALAAFSILALVGNVVSFVVRGFLEGRRAKSGFLVFVIHLCVSDFLMGVYLAVVGVADQLYLGRYLSEDIAWRNSVACKVAGVLSLISSEVSALLICLITLDRFLVLRFPFSRTHFRFRSAQLACGVTWFTGGLLAALPLLPMTSHWQFYSQTGICVPLPITRNDDFAGRDYAFAVMIVVNFVLFVFIAVGQVSIYASVNANKMAVSDAGNRSRDIKIARRLAVIVVSDFFCWFPIGLLGLLASTGTAIPGEVNVAMAIFVLPLNSALNPFLYTLNMIQEKRQNAREERLLKQLLSQKTHDPHT